MNEQAECDAAMFEAIRRELQYARSRFPGNRHMLAALTEEVGELAQALIDHERGKTSTGHVYHEAVQVAAMAMRVAIEGDASFRYEHHADECERPRARKRNRA